ncbi:ACR3 family arsenite efflux pump ArsB [Azospirillum brasilense]|uniref:ACR3 family arsenite efflux pump ArsB n=1 Tax=Azospirillum brasilense TaxID=192 RepID=A0A560CDI5_AZOBR|nr:bile acid:sodium symporter [Azospirillum brasilense]TWA82912.1 ACR3 family arsenite efflux pump ArsB [Azospirillum brasilense]
MAAVTRADLETHQVPVYFAAVAAGLLSAAVLPGDLWDAGINPALAALIYVTFLQVPLSDLRQSVTNTRFLSALLLVNFAVVPCVVFGLVSVLPAEQAAVRLGVLLVLLAPCIDYVVVFTHLGRGDARLVLAATPVLLLVQMLLLPVYLGLFAGEGAAALMQPGPFVDAFVGLIAVPLALAGATQAWAARSGAGKAAADALAWLPVPLMAVVLFLVVAAVAADVAAQARAVVLAVPLYIAFALAMPYAGRAVARLFRLETEAARAVVFSGGTRNSLVVLPLAFAVPDGGALVPAVVVTQTLVELAAMLTYVRWVPRLVPAR